MSASYQAIIFTGVKPNSHFEKTVDVLCLTLTKHACSRDTVFLEIDICTFDDAWTVLAAMLVSRNSGATQQNKHCTL